MITIDKAIKALEQAKRKVGGDKCLIVSLTGSGLEEVNVSSLKLINDKESQYVQVRASGFEGIDEHLRYDDDEDRRHGGDFDHTSPLGQLMTKARRRK